MDVMTNPPMTAKKPRAFAAISADELANMNVKPIPTREKQMTNGWKYEKVCPLPSRALVFFGRFIFLF